MVAIVGYTNAGKSTLLNALTGSNVIAEDKLFATLDTRSRTLRLPSGGEVVVTDTVGFIRDLPKDLFAAFRATFDETRDADLLLHVIDASDPRRNEQIETTEKLLVDLGLERVPRILVFNKCDKLEKPAASLANRGVPISAIDPSSLGALKEAIEDRIQLSRPVTEAEEPTSSRPA
jgi:GTP-binding protein HflX